MNSKTNHLISRDEIAEITGLYAGRLKQYGCCVKTVGWGSRRDQNMRFEMLCKGANLNGKRILDVGCGLGDFVSYMHDFGHSDFENYVGIDITPQFIEQARLIHNDQRCAFIEANIFDGLDFGTFDVVLCSGALSFRVENNLELAKSLITMMYSQCTSMVAVNFLSTRADFQLDKNYHYQPGFMLDFAASLTRFTRLMHDYPLFEFTLQLFREPQV